VEGVNFFVNRRRCGVERGKLCEISGNKKSLSFSLLKSESVHSYQ
jgi:hypothetical protein